MVPGTRMPALFDDAVEFAESLHREADQVLDLGLVGDVDDATDQTVVVDFELRQVLGRPDGGHYLSVFVVQV